MLIDAHHHLWKFDPVEYGWIDDDKKCLQADFLVPELGKIAAENQVDGFVTVQARQSVQETRDLLTMAAAEPKMAGVVGWLPLAAADLADSLEQFSDQDKLVGIRHVVQSEPDDRFLDRADFNRGVKTLTEWGLVYELLVFPKQLPASIGFADRHPNLPMVLDHIAKPAIKKGQFDNAWKRGFVELARRDHVNCKFSGVATEVQDAGWDIETIRPYFDVALEAFGPSRLMFGSDWPVCLLATEYSGWLSVVRELASELSQSEQADFFGENAVRFYGLKAAR